MDAIRTGEAKGMDITMKRPVIGSEWKRIVYYPSNHLNDFCMTQDHDGLWHCIGIMGEGTWESEKQFFHSYGKNLDCLFTNMEPILTQDFPEDGHQYQQKHAPFVVEDNRSFYMFYRRPMGTIMCLKTPDLFTFDNLGHEVFTRRDARDVCMTKANGQYTMYYCQSEFVDGNPYSCILARRSKSLLIWDEPCIVYQDDEMYAEHSYLESPFVADADEGHYLFIRHRLHDDDVKTVVLFSEDPLDFNNRGWIQELNDVHAAEIVRYNDELFIARVSFSEGKNGMNWDGWIEIAKLDFI